eukprot:scaffold150950_cov21-Tisochrysis_lutea.AAC.2
MKKAINRRPNSEKLATCSGSPASCSFCICGSKSQQELNREEHNFQQQRGTTGVHSSLRSCCWWRVKISQPTH